MAARGDVHFDWKDTHTEVKFALSNAVSRPKGVGAGDNRTMAVSKIFRDSDGDWKRVDNFQKSHVKVPIRVTCTQFTGGSNAWVLGSKLETAVDKI